MKTLTTKKLFAFIVAVMMFSFNNTTAQIIKTTFDPGITVTCGGSIPCSDSYLLDLNSDGINDFSLQVGGSAGTGRGCTGIFYANRHISVTPLNTDAVSGLKLALNAVIDANTVWNTTVQDLRRAKPNTNGEGTCYLSYTGNWTDATDGYLALKLIVNNNIYFGWAHLKLNSATIPISFTITDYAYDITPNQPIKAGGDEVLSTDNFTHNSSFKVYPNPFSDATNIAFTLDQTEKVSMRIIDLNGRLIKNLVNSYLDAGDHLIQCNSENLSAGIYFLQIQMGETLKTEKLIVTK